MHVHGVYVQVVLSHTSSVELNAFWSIFGGEHHQHVHASVGAGTAGASAAGARGAPLSHTNPMTASAGSGSSSGSGSGTDWSAASVRDNTRSFDFSGSMGAGTDVSMGMAYPEEMGGETNSSTVQAMENPMRLLNRNPNQTQTQTQNQAQAQDQDQGQDQGAGYEGFEGDEGEFSVGNPMMRRERNATAVTRFRGTTQSGTV